MKPIDAADAKLPPIPEFIEIERGVIYRNDGTKIAYLTNTEDEEGEDIILEWEDDRIVWSIKG